MITTTGGDAPTHPEDDHELVIKAEKVASKLRRVFDRLYSDAVDRIRRMKEIKVR